MALSNIEIVDAARLLYDEWQRQIARGPATEAATRAKYGVQDYEYMGAEEGYEFTINGIGYSATWWGELYYEGGIDLPDPATTPDDQAAVAFVREFAALCESYYTAVHHAAESMGWCWIEDDEYDGVYYHSDAEVEIHIPHFCTDFGEIEFPGAV